MIAFNAIKWHFIRCKNVMREQRMQRRERLGVQKCASEMATAAAAATAAGNGISMPVEGNMNSIQDCMLNYSG